MARRNIRELPDTIRRYQERIAGLAADMATMAAQDGLVIGGHGCSRKDAVALLGDALDRMPMKVYQDQRVALGIYRGLKFGIILHPQWRAEVYLDGAVTRRDSFSSDSQGPRAVLNAVDRLAGDYAAERAGTETSLAIAETQLRDYEARIGKPFAHEAYRNELEALRDELRVSLSGTPGEEMPTSEDIATKIKALTAANVVEAAPQRTGKRTTSAEEPVTARIRRRAEAMIPAESVSEPEWAIAPASVLAVPEQPSPVLPEAAATPVSDAPVHGNGDAPIAPSSSRHQAQVASRRRKKEYQPTLF
jgi:hypothetical protein